MSRGNPWNENPFPSSQTCNPSPAAFYVKDNLESFLPCPPQKNEFNTNQDLYLQNYQMPKNERSTVQYSVSVTSHWPGRESQTTQRWQTAANQQFVNGPNIVQTSNLSQSQLLSNKNTMKWFPPSTCQFLENSSSTSQHPYPLNHQLSSERVQTIQDFHPTLDQLSANASNIYQQSSNVTVMNQHSNPQPYGIKSSASKDKYTSSQNQFLRSQMNYPSDSQQYESESLFQGLLDDSEGKLQNLFIPNQQDMGSQSSSTNFPQMRLNFCQLAYTFFLSNPSSPCCESVDIYVVGPQQSGKANLIRAFSKKEDTRISTEGPLNWVFRDQIAISSSYLDLNIWYGEDLISTTRSLRSIRESPKTAIVLNYSATSTNSLTVLNWIEMLKSDAGFNIPIILTENDTSTNSDSSSEYLKKEIKDLVDNLQERNVLADFYQYSSYADAEKIFLTAALIAVQRTYRKLQK